VVKNGGFYCQIIRLEKLKVLVFKPLKPWRETIDLLYPSFAALNNTWIININ